MAISTPYKSDTVGSVSGTTFTAATGIFASTDVGRLIVLTGGNGELQHRKIVSFTSTTVVEVDHAWDATPWLDTVQDVEPSVGDSFVVSYIETDAAFTSESNVTKSGEQVRIFKLIVETGAYVHITNMQVDVRSSGVEIGTGAGLIFGWYQYIAGEDAQVKDSCHIIDDSTGNSGNQFGWGSTAGANFGMLDIYGGTILVDQGSVFWRLYHDNNPDTCQSRIINVQCFGSRGLGCRVDGYRSIFIVETVGANNATGACNARTAVSRVSITAIDGLQAGYVWLNATAGGPAGRLIFPRLNGLDKVIRCDTSGHSGTNIMEVIAKKSELDQMPVFVEASSTPNGTHTFRYGNLLKPSYVDDSNTTIVDTIKTAVIDATSTTVDTEDVTTGERSELFIRHTDVNTTFGNLVLGDANSTLYAPYNLNSFSFGKQILSTTVPAEDYFGAILTLLDDLVLTETDKATIDAYTSIDTPAQFHDRAYSFLYDNYAGETDKIVLREGNTIKAGSYNITIDAAAAQVFAFDGSTITIKTSTFNGNIETTGTFTRLNGATLNGTLNDSYSAVDGDVISVEYPNILCDGTMTITIDGIHPAQIEVIGGGVVTVNAINNAKAINTVLLETSGTINLEDDLIPSTAYSTTSAEITLQSGFTETDLTGLRGLELVDYETAGTFTTYTVTYGAIDIQGTLSIDPETEALVILDNPTPYAMAVSNGGVLNVGQVGSVNGESYYPSGTWLSTKHRASYAWNTSDTSLYVYSDGTANFNGGTMDIASPSYFVGTITCGAQEVILRDTLNQTARFTCETSSDIENFRVVNNGIYLKYFQTGVFRNNILVNAYPIGFHGSVTPLEIIDHQYIARGSLYPWGANAKWYNRNSERGSATQFNQGGGNGSFVLSTQDIEFSFVDVDGNPLDDIIVFTTETDDGIREDVNSVDFTTIQTYSATSSGGVASIPQFRQCVFFTGDDGVSYRLISRFTTSQDDTDTQLFGIISYLHTIDTPSFSIKGVGTYKVEGWTKVLDFLISESNKSTVDAYTEIDTSQKFYDRAKSYLVDNYAGEADTIVIRSGDLIDTGSYNITIDATAAAVFAFDGSTLTIKASTFVGNMITTGTVTLLNGATVAGYYTDTNGTVSNTVLTLNDLKVNSEVRVYDAGTTTELAGVENSGTSFNAALSVSSVDIVIFNTDYKPLRTTNVDTTVNVTLPIQQIFDRNYTNP